MKLNVFTILMLSLFVIPLSHAADEASLKKLNEIAAQKNANTTKALDLSGTDMRAYDLSGAKDAKIDFRKANLKGANFSGMDISHVDFGGANLEQANFEGATIAKCNFRYAKGAVNFTRTTIKHTGFNHGRFAGSAFTSATLDSVSFDFADLKNTHFDHASLIAVNFYSADLTGYTHEGMQTERSSFRRATGTGWFD